MKKVVICEDHHIVYDGLELLLGQRDDYQIVGYSPTGKDLGPILRKTKPDILILDLNLPDTDGFALLKELRKEDHGLVVIVLTMYHDTYLIEKAQREGANAYILKNTGNKELLKAMDSVVINQFYVTEATQKELDKKRLFGDRFAQKMKLTAREREIIARLAMGLSAREIAEELFVSVLTVETHRKNIFRKLEIDSIAKLIHFAHDNHLL